MALEVEHRINHPVKSALLLGSNAIDNPSLAAFFKPLEIKTGRNKDATAEEIALRTQVNTRFALQLLGEKPEPLSQTIPRLAIDVSKSALSKSSSAARRLDTIVACSSYPIGTGQAISEIVAQELGAINAQTLDAYFGCSGGTVALSEAMSSSPDGANILVVGAEHYTARMANDLNRSLFSDGASAITFQNHRDLELIATDYEQGHSNAIKMPIDYSKMPANSTWGDINCNTKYFQMDGGEVLKWVSRGTPLKQIVRAYNQAAPLAENIHILFHQGSGRMVEDFTEKLRRYGVKGHIPPGNVGETGNLGAASILAEIHHFLKTDTLKKGDVIIASAFGAGGISCTITLLVNRNFVFTRI